MTTPKPTVKIDVNRAVTHPDYGPSVTHPFEIEVRSFPATDSCVAFVVVEIGPVKLWLDTLDEVADLAREIVAAAVAGRFDPEDR